MKGHCVICGKDLTEAGAHPTAPADSYKFITVYHPSNKAYCGQSPRKDPRDPHEYYVVCITCFKPIDKLLRGAED